MGYPGEPRKQLWKIEVQNEEKTLEMNVERRGNPDKSERFAYSKERTMEEVVSPNNMGEINSSDKRRKETKEKALLESKSVDETIEAVTKFSGLFDTLCKKHKVTPCDIKANVRHLVRAAKTLVRTDGLRKKADSSAEKGLKNKVL